MKNCTGRNCIMQYGTVDPETCCAVSYCPYATPPVTNADRIRAMTDEQLAEFFEKYLGCAHCPKFYECGSATFAAGSRLSCAEYMYDWLTEEAELELQKENEDI